jgi:hypothetical protein
MKYIRFILASVIGSILAGLFILFLPFFTRIPIFNHLSITRAIPIIAYLCLSPLIIGLINERKKPKILINGIYTNYLKGESTFTCVMSNDWKMKIKSIMNSVNIEGYKFSIFEQDEDRIIYNSSEVKIENDKKFKSKKNPIIVEYYYITQDNKVKVFCYKQGNYLDISNYEVDIVLDQIVKELKPVFC